MELGILSLSDIQKNLETGETATAGRRIDQAIAYATLADRLGLEVFALGEHHTPDYAVSSPAGSTDSSASSPRRPLPAWSSS